MRWTRGTRSGNIEDRRAGGLLPGGRGGRLSLTGLLLILGISWLTGVNPLTLLGGIQQSAPEDPSVATAPPGPSQTSPEEEKLVDFVSFVLDDAQGTWRSLLPNYRDAKLVLFRGAVRSGCGDAEAAMGPFYCPADEKVYIDLAFYEELARRFGAPGDFAEAYVLAHELGHHVQHLMGTEQRVRAAQQSAPERANELSVALELQADCYAGIWAHSTERRDLLEEGDVDEGLGAASAVGDDRIQEMTTGSIHPESFTHGTARERAASFRKGYASGDPNACA
jgi:predicted metalloprotease